MSAGWTSRCGWRAVVLMIGLGLGSGDAAASTTATYAVRFDATWSAATHPVDFPASNAHWSPLIGGTHDGFVGFWSVGALASTGIRDMAERGRTTPLDTEVEAAIAAGHAGEVIRGPDISTSPGNASTAFEVSLAFSRVTLVTMIAPSPDWFAGVAGLELRPNGAWVEHLVVPLFALDAGTDSGLSYTAPNQPTVPPMLIAANSAAPFQNGVPVGTFTFTRTDAPIGAAVPALGVYASALLGLVLIGIAGSRRYSGGTNGGARGAS